MIISMSRIIFCPPLSTEISFKTDEVLMYFIAERYSKSPGATATASICLSYSITAGAVAVTIIFRDKDDNRT